ncbi:MAG: hypothetical protein LHV68_08170 [Elusimicrobia bacterium]|nr:hypothetical protein [Candidatus Liberimonas magnetica]
MKHFTSPAFWEFYIKLSATEKNSANTSFELLKNNPKHPSLRLKRIGKYWSVRSSLYIRALGVSIPEKEGIIWFWIGSHSEYERLLGK